MTRSDFAEFFRAAVRGDDATAHRIYLGMTEEDPDQALSLRVALFRLAVLRRFSDYNRGQISQFVAAIRALHHDDPDIVDQAEAEAMIATVFDPTVTVDVDSLESYLHLQIRLAYDCISDLRLSDEDLDEFLGAVEVAALLPARSISLN